ncbi:hypothetical protein RDABS01_015791, partial [Bienertia sinuspersici]
HQALEQKNNKRLWNNSGCNNKHQFDLGGGDLVAVGGKVALLPIPLGTADFLVHHIHAFTIHVTLSFDTG